MATLYVLQDRNGSDGRNNGNDREGYAGGTEGGAPGVGKNSSDSPSVSPADQPSVSNSTFTTTLEPIGSTTPSPRASDVVWPTEPSETHSTGKKQSVMTDSLTTLKSTKVVHGNFLKNFESIPFREQLPLLKCTKSFIFSLTNQNFTRVLGSCYVGLSCDVTSCCLAKSNVGHGLNNSERRNSDGQVTSLTLTNLLLLITFSVHCKVARR